MIFRSRLLFVSLFLFGLQSPAWSQTADLEKITLVEILSEPENNLHHELILHLNEQGDIEEISRESSESSQSFTLNDLLTKEVVLAQSSGLDAVKLSCASCDPNVGGNLILKYIYNGVTKSYRDFSMLIQRNGRVWNLSTQDGTGIQTLTLKARKIFGVVVGINEIGVNEFQPTNTFAPHHSTLQSEWDEQPFDDTALYMQ